ncbi:MAG: prolyl oligopeptidase family serine peptidase [Gammaproteobacteria bacterium]
MPIKIITALLAAAVGIILHACTVHEIKRQETVLNSAVEYSASPLDYLVYLPPTYDEPQIASNTWPVLFVLHGIVQTGNDLRKIPKYGPAEQIEAGRDFPFVVISPQTNNLAWDVDRTVAFIEYCLARYRIDRRRVYLTGVSSGGRAVWAVAAERPDLFAAIAPVAGWGDEAEALATAQIPTWAFHGGKDPLIWVSAAKKMQAAHRAGGGNAELTIFPDAGHTIWDEVYADDLLYDWLLSQSL